MDAIVLCGGQGSRLRGFIPDGTPKCMAQVGQKTFIQIFLEHILSYQGIKKLVFCTGYQADLVESHVKQTVDSWGIQDGMEMYFSREDKPLGTGGCIVGAIPYLDNDPTFVFNGDTLHKIDPLEMFRRLEEDDCGVAYVDKAWRYCGSYLFERRWLNALPLMTTPFSLEEAISQFGGVRKIVSQHEFSDIGTPERLSAFRTQYGK